MKARFLIFIMAVAMLSLTPGVRGEAHRNEVLIGSSSVGTIPFNTGAPGQTISTWGSPQKGPAAAPVTIAVFSDFQ